MYYDRRMMETPRCQSCGMRFEVESFYGTEADGSENKAYCKFCYQNGAFTKPDLTLQGMIDMSVHFMTTNMGFEEPKARAMSEAIIPHLKRWNNP